MNNFIIILIRCIIVALYILQYVRFTKAKKMDAFLKLKFDFRSLLEIAIVSGINLAVLVMPINDGTRALVLLGGQVMIVITFFHLNRLVIFGKKIVFLKDNPFLISDIKNFKYQKGVMTCMIKHYPLKLRLPVSDMNYIAERLSGKYYKR